MFITTKFSSALDRLKPTLFTSKVDVKIFLFCCLLIICESIPWSYKWSGVLSFTQTWDIPRGFLALVDYHGLWPLCTENLYYLNQAQAFLGVDGVSINLGNIFELQRSLYALFVKSLWFMHPILAGIFINIALWMFFCFCIQYIIKTFSPSPVAQAIGGILVAGGQGFLQSVGEISPHIMGYGAHFVIFALACRQNIWQRSFVFIDHLILYATIGFLQLAYDSAWLILPILLPISFYRIAVDSVSLKKKIFWMTALLTMALLPSFSFSLIVGILLKKGGVLYYMYSLINGDFPTLMKNYILAITDGILSYGPLLVFGYFSALMISFKEKNDAIVYLWWVSLFLFLVCGFLIFRVGGRGYVTYSFSAVIILLATYALYHLWDPRSLLKKATTISLLLFYLIFNNVPLLKLYIGNNWILDGFALGYLTVYQHPNLYRSFECDAFNQ